MHAGMQNANMHKDLERQQSFLDKMRAEVKHEIDKLTASQRLDLNLEKGWVWVGGWVWVAGSLGALCQQGDQGFKPVHERLVQCHGRQASRVQRVRAG